MGFFLGEEMGLIVIHCKKRSLWSSKNCGIEKFFKSGYIKTVLFFVFLSIR